MFDRLCGRLKQKNVRRTFGLLLAGKMLGVLLALLAIKGIGAYLFTPAFAEDAVPNTVPPYINPINTMWTLLASFLVFFMQAGFMALEAGFARTKETVNILLEGIVDTCLCGILFYAVGFAFMFGSGNGFIGLQYFFLQNTPETFGTTGVPILCYWLFQFAFADTCSTITSGAMLGRTSFVGDLIYSAVLSALIYPILGHWAWGPDGWLNTIKPAAFHDFAGSTVVHTIGGIVALAGAMALGPRVGRKFKRDGGGMPPGHDMLIASIGGIILWFGWYGFNPGSTLSAMDMQGISRVAANTTLAACAGGLSALAYIYPRNKVWDCGMTVNGFLAGLVGITASCYWVSPFGAIVIGGTAGILMILATDLIEWLRVDDPVGAVPVHGFCGVWGTLALGLFATGKFGAPTPTGADTSPEVVVTGLFYGGGVTQLVAQAKGSLAIGSAAFVTGLGLMYGLKRAGILRVAKDIEQEGIDLHEHGGPVYPEMSGTHAGAMPRLESKALALETASSTAE